MHLSFSVPLEDNGKPVYIILSQRYHMSRRMLRRIRQDGDLLVDGAHARMIDPVYTGNQINVLYQQDVLKLCRHHGIHIYYEDDDLIVCEKPTNLVTHPCYQHMDDSLTKRLSDGRLHPVMRLDRETSGLIILGKNGFAHHATMSRPMHKGYWGIVHGIFDPQNGIIDRPIGRSPSSIMIREIRNDGQLAVTHYQTQDIRSDQKISLVAFKLCTGRCHQIRVHARASGHPLVGDGLYGPRSNDYPIEDPAIIKTDCSIGRQALHAYQLSFYHPVTSKELHFESPLPDDMKKLMALQ